MTIDILKEEIRYNPEDGTFVRLKSRGNQNGGSLIKNSLNRDGYMDIRVRGLEISGQSKKYKAHRLAWMYMTGSFPENEIDHINGIRNDNRWSNLREVTRSENQRNRAIQSNSPSGILGVTWCKRSFKWKVSFLGKHHGTFEHFWDAVSVRKNLEKENGSFEENHSSLDKVDFI